MRNNLLAVTISISLLSGGVFANELNSKFIFKKPDQSLNSLLTDKSNIDFSAVSSTDRGAGADLFKKVAPSVVKILTNAGSGSGIVVSRKGLILTNHHVVAGFSSVGVVLISDQNKNEVTIGQVLRVDEVADLALVKVADDLPGYIPINIRKVIPEIGDDVHAIGHPVGEDWTYTRGYVSQIRSNYTWQTSRSEHHVANVIQTQTPINPGNSGGPLVNNSGELIGVNSFGNTRGQGLNFSVDLTTVNLFLKNTKDVYRKIANVNRDTLINTLDNNENGNPDVYLWDENQNAKADFYGVDENEDLHLEKYMIDENENGKFEIIIKESDVEGVSGILYLYDDDEDGEPESVGIDSDSDGEIDQVVDL